MSETNKQPAAQVLMIVWGAFLVTHGIFLFIGHMTHGQGAEGTAGPGDLEMMAWILTGVGAMTAIGSALAVPIFFRAVDYFTATLMRFALAESASIFGFVLAMLGAEMQWVYILTGLGVAAHVAALPSQRERELHAQRRKSGDV